MKYNKKTSTKTTNLAGGKAFVENPKLEFVSILLTSFVKDQFYRSEKEGTDRVKALMAGIKDSKFLGKAAIYARTKFGMRSISHVVAGELVPLARGQVWLKNFFDKIVNRPDDMTEILAYYLSEHGKPVPNSIKKGFSKALGRFDAYQLAKYRGEGADISLVDVVNLIHPKATALNDEALEKLVAGTLRSTDTFQTKLTKAGQDVQDIADVGEKEEKLAELKADAWKDLISKRKLGYFALLRNLRNIIEQAPEMVDEACLLLVDRSLIKKSLVLPFRYVTALAEIEKLSGKESRKVIQALNQALDISCENVPKFEGETLVALDISGSMSGKVADIAGLFGAILIKANNADLIQFSDSAHYKSVNTADSVLTIAKSITAATGGTDFNSVFHTTRMKYDRIVFLSDMQGWMGGGAPTRSLASYRTAFKADPKIYSFDLQGYGTLQFPERNVFTLAGFSEKVFDVMKLLETDREALVAEIEKVEL